MGRSSSFYRFRNCAFELICLEDELIYMDDDDEELWELVGRDLRLKSALLHRDLSQVISDVDQDHKQRITDLSNGLFWHLDLLEHAVSEQNLFQAQLHFSNTVPALQELLALIGLSILSK